jgi:arylsulfatase A-like enzyme
MPHEGITDDFIDPAAKQRSKTRGTYDGEIKYTDIHLGRVFKELETLELDDDTIVVFVADHGEEFFEHGNSEHGSSLFNELVRVPLLVRVPGQEPRRIAQVVRTVDVMPTLLDLVGMDADFEIEGKSLRRLIQGEHLSLPPALLEIQQTEATMMKGIVKGRWKLVHNISADGTLGLYDLEADPFEKKDVSAQHPDVVAELKRALENMVARAVRFGESYHQAPDQNMSPAELEALRGLGYL